MQVTGLSEFLIYGLLFLAIVGFNLFKQIASARREQVRRQNRPAQNEEVAVRPQSADRRSEPLEEPASPEAELAQEHWGRAPEPAPDRMPASLPEPLHPLQVVLAREMHEQSRDDYSSTPERPAGRRAPSSRSRSGRQLVRYRGELRHAIVLMTVIGPCRALQPYGQDQH